MIPAATHFRFFGLPPELRVMVYKNIASTIAIDTVDAENLRLVCHEIKQEFDHELVEETVHQVNELSQRLSRFSPMIANYEDLTNAAEINACGPRFKLTHTPKSFEDCQHLTFTVNPMLRLDENTIDDRYRVVNFMDGLPSNVRALTVNLELPAWTKESITIDQWNQPVTHASGSIDGFSSSIGLAMHQKSIKYKSQLSQAARVDRISSPTQNAQKVHVPGFVKVRVNWPIGFSEPIPSWRLRARKPRKSHPEPVVTEYLPDHVGGSSGIVLSIEYLASM